MKKAVGCNRACIKKAKKQPGAGFWGAGLRRSGMVFSPSARQEESSGREAGPTIWKRVIRKFLTKQPRFRRALAPRAGEVFPPSGDSGRAPFAALSRSQFLFHIIKKL